MLGHSYDRMVQVQRVVIHLLYIHDRRLKLVLFIKGFRKHSLSEAALDAVHLQQYPIIPVAGAWCSVVYPKLPFYCGVVKLFTLVSLDK